MIFHNFMVDIQLKTVKVTDETFDHNSVFLNPAYKSASGTQVLQLKDMVYYDIVYTKQINMECVGILMIQRGKHSITLNDVLTCSLVSPVVTPLTTARFTITKILKSGDKRISILNEVIISGILSNFKSLHLCEGQSLCLILEIDLEKHYLVVQNHNTGILTKETVITVDSISSNLIITTNTCEMSNQLFEPDFSFEKIGIGGLNNQLKTIFKQALTTRAFSPELIKKLGAEHSKGILLYGPPGVGKTLIARKISGLISKIPPKIINGPEIMTKWVGGSEENIRNIFKEAEEEQQTAGNASNLHVIVFDEIDAICKVRGSVSGGTGVNDSVVNQLLTKIDGVNQLNNIFIIAMTNRPDLLDPALTRPGRLGIRISIDLPTLEGRLEILRVHTEQMKVNSFLDPDVDLMKYAHLTTSYSGSELKHLVNVATNIALHESLIAKDDVVSVNDSHFMAAFEGYVPQMKNDIDYVKISPDDLDEHDNALCDKVSESIVEEIKAVDYAIRYIVNGNISCNSRIVQLVHSNVPYEFKVMIRPEILLGKDDFQINKMILDYYNNSKQFARSLIVFDDLETVIRYQKIANTVSFSSSILQTIINLAKSFEKRLIDILICCTDTDLLEMLESHGIPVVTKELSSSF